MSIYIGYWTLDPAYDVTVRDATRNGTAPRAANQLMAERVRALRTKPPAGVELLGSYTSIEPDRSVLIVDAEDHSALQTVSAHYWGVMRFEWVPALATPLTAEELDQRNAKTR